MASSTIGSVSSMGIVCGITCNDPLCKQFLYAPIVTLDCSSKHALHKACFEQLKEKNCPSCNSTFTIGVNDEYLGKITKKLDCLSKYVLNKGGSDPFKCRLLHEAARKGEMGVIRLLTPETGFDPLCTKDDRTPLFTAVHAGRERAALYFIRQGASLNIIDRYGTRLICMAIRKKLTRVVRELVERGVPVSDCDDYGKACLVEAASRGNPEVLKLVLNYGGKKVVNVSLHGYTPLQASIEGGFLQNVQLLINAGATVSMETIQKAQKEFEKCSYFYSVRSRNGGGESMIANRREIVQILRGQIGETTPIEEESNDLSSLEEKPLLPTSVNLFLTSMTISSSPPDRLRRNRCSFLRDNCIVM
jgi:hypothetical protein